MPEFVKSIFTVIFMLICFAGVLFLAYYCTRLIGKRGNIGGICAGNIKVIDRLNLSQNQSLLIVQVCGKTLLLGCTAHEVTCISELDGSLISKAEPQSQLSFAQIFKKMSRDKDNGFSGQNGTGGSHGNE